MADTGEIWNPTPDTACASNLHLNSSMLAFATPTLRRIGSRVLAVLLSWPILLHPAARAQSSMAVRHTEGLVHGFLVLRTQDGTALADGDLTQVAHGDKVSSQLAFHFKDGSLHEETVVYSQRHTFRVLSDHLVQKGPAFKHPTDVSIEAGTGKCTVRYTDDDGKEKVETERLILPTDLANGMILTLLKNIKPDAPKTTVSWVAATPKPKLVKLSISPEGEDSFSVGGSKRKAARYVVKVELGGLTGLVAPLLGKQPEDTHVWILGGDTPAFVKSEGPLYFGGPIWRIELTSPVWPEH